jgi:hypothetical protein
MRGSRVSLIHFAPKCGINTQSGGAAVLLSQVSKSRTGAPGFGSFRSFRQEPLHEFRIEITRSEVGILEDHLMQ